MQEVPDLPSPSTSYLPTLIDKAGERAAWRFLEFFTVNIRNPNTRAACKQAASSFLSWCQGEGITRIEDVLSDDRRGDEICLSEIERLGI